MPSKEDICVVADPPSFLSTDMEELVAAIKHNLHLKSKKPNGGMYSRGQRRLAPYAAPVRALCRSKADSDDHSPASCKYCVLKSSAAKDTCPDDPYEILTYLRKGILISEAVKRLQDCTRTKKRDFYELENPDEFYDLKKIESV